MKAERIRDAGALVSAWHVPSISQAPGSTAFVTTFPPELYSMPSLPSKSTVTLTFVFPVLCTPYVYELADLSIPHFAFI